MKHNLFRNAALFICLIYLLFRPLLNAYVTENIKYIFIAVMVYYGIKGLLSKKTIKQIGFIEITLCGIWVIYVILSSILVGGLELTKYSVERYLFYMIPLIAIPEISKIIKWETVFKFLTWYGFFDACISIIEFLTHKQLLPIGGIVHNVVQQYGDDSIRTFGFNGDYFLLAELLCICGFSSLYLLIYKKEKTEIIKFCVISIGIFTTGSRGYYVAYVVGLAVFYIMHSKELGRTTKYIIKMSSIFLFGFSILFLIFFSEFKTGISGVDTVLFRIRSITDWSGNQANATRVLIWKNTIEKWKTSPWFGLGASVTDLRYSGYIGLTESGFLKRLVELGIVGTVLQYLTMFVPFIKGLRHYSIEKRKKDASKVVLFTSIIVALMVEDMILQRYGEIEFTIIIWCALGYICSRRKKRITDIIRH